MTRTHAHANPIRLAFGGMLALTVAMGIGRFVYTPLLPMMADAEGLSASEAGLIASGNYAGYLAGAMLAAISSPRGSRRRWMLGALLGSSATTALMAFADGYAAFMVIRFAAGVASAWVLVFASSLVMEGLAASRQDGLAALHFAGVGAGIVLASLLVTLPTLAGGDWRVAWICNGIAGLALWFVVARLVVVDEPPSAISADGARRDARPMLGLLVGYGLFGFGYVVTATFIVQLVRSAGLSLSSEAMVWALVGTAAIPSVLLWRVVAVRIGNRSALAIACAVEALGVSASVLGGGLDALVVSAVLLGGTFMGITFLGLVEARVRAGGDPRRALATMTASFGAGQIVGPGLAGVLRDLTGSFLWPTLLATLALLIAAMLMRGTG